ncbi:glycosyltransferase BC10-like isoform X2 [Nicotiana tabacum]|uniref:Glycosyltransferase BC10-like isoform X2 n=1 Tax=Nicotiana tabacum TaxID=4097 RepID=A0A1S3XI46_TOBAC
MKNKGEDVDSPFSVAKDLPISLLRVILMLIIFVVGVVIGLSSTSHIKWYFTLQPQQIIIANNALANTMNQDSSGNCKKEDCLSMGSFFWPKVLIHGMSDDELFWRASLVPYKEEYLFKRVPKVAFMFLTRGDLPLLRLWERFFDGQDVNKYSIFVHSLPGYVLSVSNTSVFYKRQIPSQVEWGSVTLVDAERRLLANALLDFSNERFVLLSDSCIPLYSFPTVYKYLIGSIHSFVESYDDPSSYGRGRGRYNHHMQPDIKLSDWRKGSQWFEMNRKLAVRIVLDTKYYNIFRKYCTPTCYPDEHYIPTYIRLFYGPSNANRTVTYVDWSLGASHPATFSAVNITEGFIESLRNNGAACSYNSEKAHICYLFARMFDPSALKPLLNLSSKVLKF